MKNPRIIETLDPGVSYELPTYKVTNDGIQDGEPFMLKFCKGNTQDENQFRQEGFFTESLVQVAKQYLESVNVGGMKTNDTTQAILKLEEALLWIGKRAEDRKLRGVQGTYQK